VNTNEMKKDGLFDHAQEGLLQVERLVQGGLRGFCGGGQDGFALSGGLVPFGTLCTLGTLSSQCAAQLFNAGRIEEVDVDVRGGGGTPHETLPGIVDWWRVGVLFWGAVGVV
jgi:hypothetical protein